MTHMTHGVFSSSFILSFLICGLLRPQAWVPKPHLTLFCLAIGCRHLYLASSFQLKEQGHVVSLDSLILVGTQALGAPSCHYNTQQKTIPQQGAKRYRTRSGLSPEASCPGPSVTTPTSFLPFLFSTVNLFSVFTDLSFEQCYENRIIQCITLWDYLLSLSMVTLWLIPVAV